MALAVTAYFYANSTQMGDGAQRIVVVPPEKVETQLKTGVGSAQFSIYAPQYPGSDVIGASHIIDGSGGVTMVTMESEDDLATVSEFYRRELTNKAFDVRLTKKGDGLTIMAERMSAGLSVMIALDHRDGGGTRIELSDTTTIQ